MVMMPMRKKGLLDSGLFRRQNRLESLRPAGLAFASVDEKPLGTPADEVCIRACWV